MKTKLGSAVLAAVLLLSGCVQRGGGQSSKAFAVVLNAETTPGSKSYRTYILDGGGTTDFQSIKGQALERKVKSALATKGFIQASSRSSADLIIFVFTGSDIMSTPMTYTTPRTVYVPGTTHTSTTTTQLPGGYSVPSQTVTRTQGQTINAGVDRHTYNKYGIVGTVSISAGAWSEWVKAGAVPGTRARVVWETKVHYFGDPPSTPDIAEKCLESALRHAGDTASYRKEYTGTNMVIEDLP